MMHIITFESPDIGAIDFFLVKSVGVLSRYIMFGYPIYIVFMNWSVISIAQHCSFDDD